MRRALLLLALVLAACPRPREAARTHEDALEELAPDAFPTFADDLDPASLEAALVQSLAYYRRVLSASAERTTWFGREAVPVRRVVRTLERMRELLAAGLDSAALNARIREEFRVFRSTGRGAGEVLFTGYYLPELRGSLAPDPSYPVPLHRVPEDLVVARARDFPQLEADLIGRVQGDRLVPYPSRAEIGAGALGNRSLELLWVDSPIDAFFLEIQGSGVVRLADGSSKVVTYAGKNGQAYFAVGKALVERGVVKPEQLSMQAIRAWLEANPAERDAVLNRNPSYVFFRLADAAMGALDLPVTAGRTIAADSKVFPKGALAFIDASRPDPATKGDVPLRRFVVDQDSGGAIRSAARVDVFWGAGAEAAAIAGRMKHTGRLYYLLLRDDERR
jgi:membrane-bound lytic murein transglycosylase A